MTSHEQHPTPRLRGVHASMLARPAREESGLSFAGMDAILEAVDDYAIDRLSVGDHQGNHPESYAGLGYLAAKTSRVHIGPYVTNAVARDAGLIAASLATLDALSRGRIFWVLGSGDGVLRNLGLKPSTVAQTREALLLVRSLLRNGGGTYQGRTIRLPWPDAPAARIPLYIAASGPRMMQTGAEVADGLYVAAGLTADAIDSSRAHISAAAEAAGRDAPPDLWWVTRFGIGNTYEEALDNVAESLSSIGNHALRDSDFAAAGVPAELHEPLAQYHARYDWARKNANDGGPTNADLMVELGLQDYFLDRFAIVGTPAQIVDRINELVARGADQLVVKVENRAQLDLLGRDVLPHVTGSQVQPA